MVLRTTVMVVLAASLAGCMSGRQQQTVQTAPTAPGPAPTRATATTAPADLQLLCASEAAARFNVDSNQALPVASSPTADGAFAVQVSLAGGTANCIVDQTGTILSIDRA